MECRWSETSVQEKLLYLHHKVLVTTLDRKEYTGWVFTIDPVTHSLVLDENGDLTTILGQSVFTVNILATPTTQTKEALNSLLEKEIVFDPFVLQRRKTCLANWLEKNRFPIQMFGDKITVAQTLTIHPPYNSESCETSNEIILERVQNLIAAMPDRF